MTVYRNEFGTEIDVPDELVASLGGVWSTGAVPTPSAPSSGSPAAPEVADGPPPKGGKGSSDSAWTSYAQSRGVKVTEDMTRKEVIAACEAAGVPVE